MVNLITRMDSIEVVKSDIYYRVLMVKLVWRLS